MSNEQPKKAMSADEFFAQQGVGANNDVNAGVNNVGVNAKTENERTNNMQEMYKRAQSANTSGRGSQYPVPDVVAKRFNWGAFLLTWIWGLGNSTYITLLIFAAIIVSLIPIVGWIVPFGLCIWFGIKGNEWAWQNKYFPSINDFHNYQRKWAIAGIIWHVVGIILSIIIYVTIFAVLFSNSGHMTENYNNVKYTQTNLSEYENENNARMQKLDADIEKALKDNEEQMKKIDAMLKDMEKSK